MPLEEPKYQLDKVLAWTILLIVEPTEKQRRDATMHRIIRTENRRCHSNVLELITFSANGRFSFLLQSKQEYLRNDPEHPSYCELMSPTQIPASEAKSRPNIQLSGRAMIGMVTPEKLAAMQSETLDSGIRRALLKAAF